MELRVSEKFNVCESHIIFFVEELEKIKAATESFPYIRQDDGGWVNSKKMKVITYANHLNNSVPGGQINEMQSFLNERVHSLRNGRRFQIREVKRIIKEVNLKKLLVLVIEKLLRKRGDKV